MTDIDRTAATEALRAQMRALGLTANDLADEETTQPHYLPTVRDAVARMKDKAPRIYSAKTVKTYATGWNLLEELHGDDHMDALDFEDIEDVLDVARDRALARRAESNRRRAARGQRPLDTTAHGAVENALSAIKALYARELKKARRSTSESPAHQITLDPRPASGRRPLERWELADVFRVARRGGDDPALDTILLRTAYELGARQEGLINLRLTDLDHGRQTAKLDEKYGKRREQPATVELLEALRDFAARRGSTSPTDPVFRYRDGKPLTSRRFDTLFGRIRKELEWADRAGVGAALHPPHHRTARRTGRGQGDRPPVPRARPHVGHR